MNMFLVLLLGAATAQPRARECPNSEEITQVKLYNSTPATVTVPVQIGGQTVNATVTGAIIAGAMTIAEPDQPGDANELAPTFCGFVLPDTHEVFQADDISAVLATPPAGKTVPANRVEIQFKLFEGFPNGTGGCDSTERNDSYSYACQ
jgi:hypothetical protein